MTLTDPVPTAVAEALADVDLVYVTDDMPGITRQRTRTGSYRYTGPDGELVRDIATLSRIKGLAIPPAWTEVWSCPISEGHLQATGRDAKRRKQYRYHPRWRAIRDETKYQRTIAFGEALPAIRARVEEDLSKPGLPREKVLATVVKLLETTLIRVGNEEYTRANKSFGLTTMRDRHVKVEGSSLRFEFRGKSGKDHSVAIRDRRLARIVQKLQDIKGQELFQYVDDDGTRRKVDSSDVNAYLREISGQDFTAKDFRTWAGTVLAAIALEEFETFASPTEAKRNLLRAVENVAKQLGNTAAICRKCYVHPDVIDVYMEGALVENLKRRAEEELIDADGLQPEEAAVLAILRQRLQQPAA